MNTPAETKTTRLRAAAQAKAAAASSTANAAANQSSNTQAALGKEGSTKFNTDA